MDYNGGDIIALITIFLNNNFIFIYLVIFNWFQKKLKNIIDKYEETLKKEKFQSERLLVNFYNKNNYLYNFKITNFLNIILFKFF